MNDNVARPIALSNEPPRFDLSPTAPRITSDQQALAISRELGADFAKGAAERDRELRLPAQELDRFSGSGLWGITVPKSLRRGGGLLRHARGSDRRHFGGGSKPRPAAAESSGGARCDQGDRDRRAEAFMVRSCVARLSPRQRFF